MSHGWKRLFKEFSCLFLLFNLLSLVSFRVNLLGGACMRDCHHNRSRKARARGAGYSRRRRMRRRMRMAGIGDTHESTASSLYDPSRWRTGKGKVVLSGGVLAGIFFLHVDQNLSFSCAFLLSCYPSIEITDLSLVCASLPSFVCTRSSLCPYLSGVSAAQASTTSNQSQHVWFLFVKYEVCHLPIFHETRR